MDWTEKRQLNPEKPDKGDRQISHSLIKRQEMHRAKNKGQFVLQGRGLVKAGGTLRVDFGPKPVTCPRLHLAPSPRVQSLFHRSAETTNCVRGDGSQTELRQTVAIQETTCLCEPASPHHCLPCVRIKGPMVHFCPSSLQYVTRKQTQCF